MKRVRNREKERETDRNRERVIKIQKGTNIEKVIFRATNFSNLITLLFSQASLKN
jgi:hypothetical protein